MEDKRHGRIEIRNRPKERSITLGCDLKTAGLDPYTLDQVRAIAADVYCTDSSLAEQSSTLGASTKGMRIVLPNDPNVGLGEGGQIWEGAG